MYGIRATTNCYPSSRASTSFFISQQASTAASASIPVVIPQDGNASTTEVQGEKKLLASLYADTSIKNADQLHADLTTLR